MSSVFGPGGDPPDGPGNDQGGQEAVAVLTRKFFRSDRQKVHRGLFRLLDGRGANG